MDREDEDGMVVDPHERARQLDRRVDERQVAARRPGPGPYVLGLRPDADTLVQRAGHPFDLAVVRHADDVRLDAPVTLLAGDNGTGKSTYVEALAEAMGFAPEGGQLERSGEHPARPRPVLDGALTPVLTSRKPHGGYFLRAESFFNVAQWVDSGDKHAPDLSIYGDVPLHGQSHGQSFLALAANRFGGEGLYLLDEPEAALSLSGVLALLAIVMHAAGDGAQFVIATHSPVLLACPGARLYELHSGTVAECTYDDLEAIRLTRGFLTDPARYLRAALGDDAAP